MHNELENSQKKYNNNEKKKMAEPVKVLNKKELNLKKFSLFCPTNSHFKKSSPLCHVKSED